MYAPQSINADEPFIQLGLRYLFVQLPNEIIAIPTRNSYCNRWIPLELFDISIEEE